MPQQISQKDFADQMRKRIPELKDFSDDKIVKKLMEMRPELKDIIRTPDQAAAEEQSKTEKRSHSMVDPETWKDHPNAGQFLKSVLSALPGIGAIGGGAAATPETLGMGTIAGGALGAGAGRGLQDITSQMLGLEDTSPLTKVKNIGMDTGLTAITPGAMTAIKHPIDTSRLAAGAFGSAEDALIPKALRPFTKLPFLEKWAEGPGPSSRITPLARYSMESSENPILPNSPEMEQFINQVFNKRP